MSKSPQINEIITAFETRDDAALIRHYWLVRVQVESQHNTRLKPAWERLQNLLSKAPEKFKSILGSVPTQSKQQQKTSEEQANKTSISSGSTSNRSYGKNAISRSSVAQNLTAYTSETRRAISASNRGSRASVGYQFEQPSDYDLEEAASIFVLETLAPNVPYGVLEIQLDGKIHRFQVDGDKDKAACYQFQKNGNGASGWFRYWRVHQDSAISWKFDFKKWNERHSPIKLNGYEAVQEQQRRQKNVKKRAFDNAVKRAEAEQTRDNAATLARNEYQTATPATSHSYLTRKGVPCVSGLKLDRDGNLLVPLFNENGEVCNLQRFVWSNKDQKFNKFYFTGASRAGTFMAITANGLGFFPAQGLPSGAIIGICEGLATGLSAFEAIRDTGGMAVCAMDAAHLEATALIVRRRFPGHKIYIFADNDWFTALKTTKKRNPGLDAARKAATAIKVPMNVIAPDFDFSDTSASDWNDFMAKYGKQAMIQSITEKIKIADEKVGRIEMVNE